MVENHQSGRKPPLLALAWRAEVRWILLFALVAAAFFWKLVLTDQYVWFDHPDMAFLEIPRLQFLARELHRGHFPLWDPHLWSGQPLIGQTQPGPVFPFNLLFGSLNLRGGYLRFSYLNAYWVFLHFLAGAFFFLLARALGASRAVSLFGASLYAFGGFLGSVAWLDVANGAIWAPLVFLFVLRAAHAAAPWRDAAAGGFVLGLAWLSGHHEIPLLLSLAAAATWVWQARSDRRLWLAGALFAGIAILISAVQLIPMIEFGRLSRRWIGLENSFGWRDRIPYVAHTIYSLQPRAVLGLVLTEFSPYADTSLYAGWLAATLAAVGVVAGWGSYAGRWAVTLGALSLIYSLGSFTPFNGLLYALVPMMNKARVPVRGVALLNVAISILACFGLEAILRAQAGRFTRAASRILALAGTSVLLISLASNRLEDQKTALGALVALTAAAVLAAWTRAALSRILVAGSLLALLLIDLSSGGVSSYPNRADKDGFAFAGQLHANQDIAYHLMAVKDGPVRISVDDQHIGSNYGDWHGLDMLQGYVAGATANLLRHELHLPRVQDLFSVTHWISDKPNRPDQQDVYHADSGLIVYRNPSALPRVRSVHQTLSVSTEDQLRAALRDPEVDLARTAVFLGPAPSLATCSGSDHVRLTGRTSDSLALDATMACQGLVVIADTYFPGWQATVDGKPAPILEVYGALRGVVVGPGHHRIEMRYRPISVYSGLALSLIGVLVTVIVFRLPRFQ